MKTIEKIAKGPYMHKGKDYKHKMKMGKGGMTY